MEQSKYFWLWLVSCNKVLNRQCKTWSSTHPAYVIYWPHGGCRNQYHRFDRSSIFDWLNDALCEAVSAPLSMTYFLVFITLWCHFACGCKEYVIIMYPCPILDGKIPLKSKSQSPSCTYASMFIFLSTVTLSLISHNRRETASAGRTWMKPSP